MKQCQILCFTLLVMLKVALCSKAVKSLALGASSLSALDKGDFKPLNIKLPKVPVYYENWVRYYHYVDKPGNHVTNPKTFFKNRAYFEQQGERISNFLNKKDKQGRTIFIQSKADFYMVLYKESLAVFSQRVDIVQHQVDMFRLENIVTIPEDKYLQGGVRNLGKFKAGYCIEIILNSQTSLNKDKPKIREAWIFCLDTKKDKDVFLSLLIKLKLKLQRNKKGMILSQELVKTKEAQKNSMAKLMKEENRKLERDTSLKSPLDGQWILLQDWTTCSLKCGGGRSYKQWQCIPPKNGGKPCEGEAVREKACNLQKCPEAKTVLEVAEQSKPEVVRPTIATGPFTSRLNHYIKCQIKETDAYLTTYETETKMNKKLPIRLVMNAVSMSLYGDDTNENLIHSFELDNTAFIKNKDFCCFSLKDNMKLLKLCGFEQMCYSDDTLTKLLDPSVSVFATNWEKEFKLFNEDCKQGRETTLLNDEDEEELQSKIKKKVNQVEIEMLNEKRQKVKESTLAQNIPGGKNYKMKVAKAKDVTFKAIEKELRYEKMLQNEEKQKEEAEVGILLRKIEDEKGKERCMEANIEEKQLDEMFELEQREAEKEVVELKQEAVSKIKVNRSTLMKKLSDMKAKADSRKSQLESELNVLRRQMANKFLRSNRAGDMGECREGFIKSDKRTDYCDNNFRDDFVQNVDCQDKEQFCFICCETEFGNMHVDKRDGCYNMCDTLKVTKQPQGKKKEKTNEEEPMKAGGNFMWDS